VLVLAGIAVAAVVLLAGGSQYRVTADFVSASQLVKGNRVNVAGEPVGSVEDIALTHDGQARVTLSIDDDYAPLRRGTRAIVRQASLSGVANRYVDLQLGGADQPAIPDGGRIEDVDTEASVDLDQLFNVFDPAARRGARGTIRLFAQFNAGRTDEANAAFRLLNPALSSASRLFDELNRNRGTLERFIVETSKLVTDVSARREDLAGLVTNLDTTLDAVASRRDALGEAIGRSPAFLRRANTTFVNLRRTLDALDPLVADAKPVVRDKLIPLFDQLRPFARQAEPTVRDLSLTIRRPGAGNDLIELLRAQPALAQVATQEAQRNGERRPGAFGAVRDAARGATPQLAFTRPYTVDLVGWFDDFSSSGVYDALGGFSRSGLELNAFTLTPTLDALPSGSDLREQLLKALPQPLQGTAQALVPVPPDLRGQIFSATVATGRDDRCPGAVERPAPDGSNPWKPSPDFGCDLSQRPPG
jgi:phospholipid/cholesterol/gamma-HCH transport system substrate-binding protein